jgi:hypothetical protein
MIFRLELRYLSLVFRPHSDNLLFEFKYALLKLENLALRSYRQFRIHCLQFWIFWFASD